MMMSVKASGLACCLVASLLSVAVVDAAVGDLRLVEAAKTRDKVAVRVLLNERVDVNSRHRDGTTALHWAAHWNDLDTADLLIRAGADANAIDDLGVMPLALASMRGDGAMVQKLLDAGANPNAAFPAGETPLMIAARTGIVDSVKALLVRGANVNAKEATRGQTALMWAAAQKHTGVVRTLIESGADVHARSNGGYTPLLFTARAGDIDTARVLLAAGARVDDASVDGHTGLIVATLMGHVEFAKFMLDNGADIAAAGGGFTALHWAAGTWDNGITGPFGVKVEDSEWSLMAGLRGTAKLDFVKELLARGADPNALLTKEPPRGGGGGGGTVTVPLAGATPFLLAAMGAEVDVMRLLVSSGADPSPALKNHRTTAVMLAAGMGRAPGISTATESQALEATKLALELGGDVNAFNVSGSTALHAAAFWGANTLVQFLVEKGAALNTKNKRGDTAYMIANGQGPRSAGENTYHPETAQLLRQLGADTSDHCDWPCGKGR